jgi:hypothetical protein
MAMRRILLVALALGVGLTQPATAGKLGREIKSSWLGAWVVLRVEAYSECGAGYTNNRVNGDLVRARSGQRFQPGELAKLESLNVRRSRIDLRLALAESVLVAYDEGPFTLYREAECRLDLEVMVPREAVKQKNADAIDEILASILERYPTEEQARMSEDWNGREREEYPADYEDTLARLELWRVERHNAHVQQQLDLATEETERLPGRIQGNSDYLAGFAEGVQRARGTDLRSCFTLMAVDLDELLRDGRTPENDPAAARRDRGLRDGQLLVYSLALLREGPQCFQPLPEEPGE